MTHIPKAAVLAATAALATPALATDWTGFYLGAQGSYGEISGGGAGQGDAIGGLQAGYNYDFGNNWVVGGEVDYNFDNRSFGANTMDDSWSLKGRVGYSLGDTLIYGTVGGVRAGITNAGTTTQDTGFLYGIGVEQRLNTNWSVAGELTQTKYQNFGGGGSDFDDTKASIKVNYRF